MKPYIPSNGTEGLEFTSKFCECCQHWQEGPEPDCPIGCPIANATLFSSPGDVYYPSQWVQNDDGKNARCLAHFPKAKRKIVETTEPLSPEQKEWLERTTKQ